MNRANQNLAMFTAKHKKNEQLNEHTALTLPTKPGTQTVKKIWPRHWNQK
jgi:hypothetical protein